MTSFELFQTKVCTQKYFSIYISGLCGNYDGNPYNDIPISNSSYLKKTSNSRLPTYSLDLYSLVKLKIYNLSNFQLIYFHVIQHKFIITN